VQKQNVTDIAITVFSFSNRRGYSVPPLNVVYEESDTEQVWQINCGGTRGYFARSGETIDNDMNAQAADSHFMAQRITAALLISGFGLFEADATGRLIFTGISGPFDWSSHIDRPDPLEKDIEYANVADATDWLVALCTHTVLRRAIYDARQALLNPHEALVFVYRGLEWLKVAQKLKWDDVASDLGVTTAEIKDLTKFANVETGVRHASRSGKKMRASLDNYGTWVCGLIDGINAARARIDPGFSRMTAKQVAAAVARAAPLVPFP